MKEYAAHYGSAYTIKLSSRKSITPILRTPLSLYQRLQISWLKIIFGNESPVRENGLFSGSCFLICLKRICTSYDRFLSQNCCTLYRFILMNYLFLLTMGFASLLLANGVLLKQIQDWMGHLDFSIAANIYANLDYSLKPSSTQTMVSRMQLLKAGNFGSRREQNAAKNRNKAKSCSFQNVGKNS